MSAQDQPINGLPYETVLQSDDIFYFGRTSLGTAGDRVITAPSLLANLKNPLPVKVTCNYNQMTLISFGMPSDINSIVLHCNFNRNGQSRSELIILSYQNGDQSLGEGWVVTVPSSVTDLGISLDCDSSYTLNLQVHIDNSINKNVVMSYNIISRL